MTEEREGAESRAAVAEAAASLKSDPKFQEAARELVTGEDAPETPPEPSPEPKPESPAEPGEQEGRPSEPAATPPSSEEDTGEDYDPEAHAEYPDEDELKVEPKPEPIVREAEPAPTPEPTPSSLSEDELREFQEFQEFRRQRDKQEPPPEAEPARFGQPPTPQDLRGVIEELTEANSDVKRAVGNLEAIGSNVQTNHKRLQTMDEESKKLATERSRAEAKITALQDMAKDADLDESYMGPRLQEAQQALLSVSNREQRLLLDAERLERQTAQLEDDYRNGLQAVHRAGMDEWNDRARQAQEDQEYEAERESATAEWNEVVPRIVKDWGIDPSLTNIVTEELSRLSEGASDEDLVRLEPWMRTQREPVMKRFDVIRKATLRSYAEDKRADTTQPAPPPDKAIAPPRPPSDAPLSSKAEDRRAHKSLIQSLRSARGT